MSYKDRQDVYQHGVSIAFAACLSCPRGMHVAPEHRQARA